MSAPDIGTRATPATIGEAQEGRRSMILAVLLLGQFMGSIDVLIVNVAMPEIGTNLHTSGATLQMVVGGYTVSYAMLLITGARLGDLYGRRRMYMLGAIVFTTASLGCGFAPHSLVLVLLRFIQGAGAAVMIPQIISVIQMWFTGAARAKAMSAYGVVLSSGSLVGLVLGGVLVSANVFGLGWRSVFLINVPLGVLLIMFVPRVVPADRPTGTRRIDGTGLLVATAAVFAIVLPLVLGHDLGWPAWTFICIAVGLALAVLFVPLERGIQARGGDPLLHLDVLRTGLTYIPMGATFGVGGFAWRQLPERLPHALAPGGLALSALGYLGIAVAMSHGGQGSPLMWLALTLTGAGLGLSASPLMAQSLSSVARIQAADASGVLTTTIQLGQVIGVAVFGTVFFSLLKVATAAHPLASAGALRTRSPRPARCAPRACWWRCSPPSASCRDSRFPAACAK